VSRVWLGSPGMPVERRYPHQAHHGHHVLRADDHPSKPQQVLEHPVPAKGVFPRGTGMQLGTRKSFYASNMEAQQEDRGDTSLNPEEDVSYRNTADDSHAAGAPGTLDHMAVRGA